MNTLAQCHIINDFLSQGEENQAREALIRLLDFYRINNEEYTPLINHLIRLTGLYPYINLENADWQDRFVYEAFKEDVGLEKTTLHREQSRLLKLLLDGKNIAVSAPTSFGKSFVIDAFIAIKNPKNVVIIVPTIALTDEIRRRMHKKFSDKYKIITTTDVELSDRNIFIFPQERALIYTNKIESIDMLIVDEFYKASQNFDKERSPSLLKAMVKLGTKSAQKYYIAPHISGISDNVFTQSMEFVDLSDFNTVVLEINRLQEQIKSPEDKKSKLIEIMRLNQKTLIYAGTYREIENLTKILTEHINVLDDDLTNSFANWLSNNYSRTWNLIELVRRGIGVHNGQIHRSLAQLQIKLFDAGEKGLRKIVSTSSMIEGVNTAAESVVIWNAKNGTKNIDAFTYKNIIGRSGRMFKYFVGNVYLLDTPKNEQESTQLEIPFQDDILGDLDESLHRGCLNDEQVKKIISYKEEMQKIMGKDNFNECFNNNSFRINNYNLILSIAKNMRENPQDWNVIKYLNSRDSNHWSSALFKLLEIGTLGYMKVNHTKFVAFIKIISKNWEMSMPYMIAVLNTQNISINDFFSLEREVAFKLSAIANDVSILAKYIINKDHDISPFLSRCAYAFLPKSVYHLEEYGLPRMLSKKIHNSHLIDLEDNSLTLPTIIDNFNDLGRDPFYNLASLDSFDKYIIDYFFEGISLNNKR